MEPEAPARWTGGTDMNTAAEARLDAQARQMAFELGYGADPRSTARAAHPATRNAAKTAHPSSGHGRKLTVVRPATEAQIGFIKRLVGERVVVPGTELHGVLELSRHMAVSGAFTTQAASALIDALQAAPRKEQERTTRHAAEPEDGMYLDGDTIFKVYKMVHGSGRQGVKRLEVTGKEGSFVYLGLAARRLPTTAQRMTLEQAAKYGRLYGFCVRCGRTLTDEESIAAGIGPICADKM
jgi:hypothetical protein